MDVLIRPEIVDVQCSFGIENVSGWNAAHTQWSTCYGGEVGVMPTVDIPFELVDMTVGPLIGEVLGLLEKGLGCTFA
jgi:hypothetical protein